MKYAFLGAGKMASALAHGMLRAGLCHAADLVVSSRSRSSLDKFCAATGASPAETNTAAAKDADVVILGVKPTDALVALKSCRDALAGKLLISVATGVKISKLQEAAPGCRVVRAMPNTAAMVGRSATAIASQNDLPSGDGAIAEKVFQAVGNVYAVSESQMDAVTGLSGSGPAYIYLVMEALSDGGVAVGLPRKLALELAIQTVAGAAEMAISTKEHPALLREMVTSPGGTTIAALATLENAAVRSAFIDAVGSAARRSRELSRE
ncbi:pyrroline-5-carboxylate reductase [soil metagenome]